MPLPVTSRNDGNEPFRGDQIVTQALIDTDILVAGVALANGLELATHNTSHFGRIEGLQVQDWSLE
jgi:predicted nucleic acid-binding protein